MTAFASSTFLAMGTDVEVLAAPTLPDGAVGRVQGHFASMEAIFSRFIPDSELSCLNRAAGRPFAASQLFREVLNNAIAAARESNGLFDPLLLSEVKAAGYRESIDVVRGSVQIPTAVSVHATFSDIRVCNDGTVIIPEASGLDFGGFVKGWTVDHCAPLMADSGNWLINAGGDRLARGDGPDGGGWIVGVEDPFAPGNNLAVIRVRDAAIATSSTMRRRWTTQAGIAHHLIDPRTGLPAETDLVSVTVAANSVARAEVLAKQLLLFGGVQASTFATHNGVPAIFIDDCGSATATAGMEAHLVI
jgi:thiamine biosynthesis lipoprotein